MMTAPSLSYCGEEVRQQDHDRFLTCLFAPAAAREHLFTLYAFNLEIAKTAEMVSEAMLGHIRLQWWRESLDGIYQGTPRRHAVVEALAETILAHDLPRKPFDAAIDGREQDLDEEPPKDLPALEAYADATSGAITGLAAMILGIRDDSRLQAARQVGTGFALVGLLRAVRFHAAGKRLYLPSDLIDRHDLARGDLFELRPSTALNAVTREIAARARWNLEQARSCKADFARSALSSVLAAVIAEQQLKILEGAGWNPLDPSVQVRSQRLAWRLSLAYLIRRY